MTLREFYNTILAIIGAESLTDIEFATVTSPEPAYDQMSYDDLARVLISRDTVSTTTDRLLAYYQARGVSVTPAKTGKSNILIGIPL